MKFSYKMRKVFTHQKKGEGGLKVKWRLSHEEVKGERGEWKTIWWMNKTIFHVFLEFPNEAVWCGMQIISNKHYIMIIGFLSIFKFSFSHLRVINWVVYWHLRLIRIITSFLFDEDIFYAIDGLNEEINKEKFIECNIYVCVEINLFENGQKNFNLCIQNFIHPQNAIKKNLK